MQVDAIGMVMAVSAGLSIIMTVFVFPYLHHRIPENLFLRLCRCFVLLSDWNHLIPRSTRISRWSHLLPIRLVLQLHFRCFSAEERLCSPSASDGLSPDGRLFSHVSQLTFTYRCQLKSRLLDTVVLDKIPYPEYLALANSLTFSVAVSDSSARPTSADK